MNLRYHFELLFIVVSSLFVTYTNAEFRIINGIDWDIASSPHLVSLNYSGKSVCVGSLITLQKVLTAWHCLIGKYMSLFTIIAGVTDLRYLGVTGQISGVETVFWPTDFSYQTGTIDIAVIEVNESFYWSPTVQTIPLCETTLAECDRMQVSGWGWTTNDGNPSPTLKTTVLRVISFDQCAERYRLTGTTIAQSMVCAAVPGSDACNGDSGSPGVVGGTLCAVVSFNRECNHPHYPTVFTNINDPDVRDLIRTAMEDDMLF